MGNMLTILKFKNYSVGFSDKYKLDIIFYGIAYGDIYFIMSYDNLDKKIIGFRWFINKAFSVDASLLRQLTRHHLDNLESLGQGKEKEKEKG